MIRTIKWLPNPLLSLTLFVLWLLLVNSMAPGHVVLGVLFGLVIPLFTETFRTERSSSHRPDVVFRLALTVLWDIVVANLVVARLILGRSRSLRPSFVHMPLALSDTLAITVLAGIVSLTPGTVSADVGADHRTLLIHCLDLDDEKTLVNRIQKRYEAPLKEIFRC